MDQHDLISAFDEDVPQQVQRELVQLVAASYERSWAEAGDLFDTAFRKTMAGQLRWARIEEGLMTLAERHGLVARPIENANESARHVELVVGRFIITASSVDSAWAMVPSARFRETLAADTQQLLPLPQFVARNMPPDGHVYAALLHVRSEREPGMASCIGIGFPDSSLKGYLAKIDLLHRFRLASAPASPKPQSVAVPEPVVVLKSEEATS